MSLDLEYFYGNEAEQYSFYRIPKTLFTDQRYKGVSMEAKVLYGMMLDRMGLSIRSGWLDEDGRVYIYFTLEDAIDMLGCGKDKAVRLFKELDMPSGIGLIERRKQGQGKPARVYVKKFTLPQESNAGEADPPPTQTSEIPQSGLREESAPQTSEKPQSALRKTSRQDCGKADPNNTDKNKTEKRDTESIYPPAPLPPPLRRPVRQDRMDQMDAYRALIHENISYGDLLRGHPYDADLIDGYVELMVEVCCTRKRSVRINQEELPTDVVRSRFLKLDREHILYVMESLRQNTTRIGNIRAYTLSALYNAPVTIKEFYAIQRNYFASTGNHRKDAMLRLMQQITLLLRASAAPNSLEEYEGDTPVKILTAVEMAAQWEDQVVAIGVRHKVVLDAYTAAIREFLPDRPLFVVTGETTTFAKRRALRKTLRESGNGILLCTQQSLPSSVNFEFVNKVIIPELHYNNAAMSQFYMRFIRYNSTEYKDIYFLTYAGSLESNLMQMVLVKEKINLFMKGQDTDLDEIYERFGIDYDLLALLMRREADEEGHFQIRWGEQKIA